MKNNTALKIAPEDNGIEFFLKKLERGGASPHTIDSYRFAVSKYLKDYGEVNRRNLAVWRNDLIDRYAPRTVCVRITAMNTYLKYLKKDALKLQTIKIQQKPFLDNVISMADYEFLKKKLKKDGNLQDYFLIWFLGATGARVAEFAKLKAEHVQAGHVDIYGKGTKMRRIYIPENLRKAALLWLAESGKESGYLFTGNAPGSHDAALTSEGIRFRLNRIGKRYGIDKTVMHPHSFRHMFGKAFFEQTKDLALLADLMGHESIDTTRIYTRRTATEQRELVDKTVTW
ncbi:MAG: tyrosine-type recombinase/integrase [Clostridiales Family XIII bacterium]|jgi:site-specific recombinase XerD|nr:tyrosine-type recombinase/integrase [Clostridiales Family XIII bacterium]